MIREIGLWAGEVGNIVAMGMGDMLDTTGHGRSRTRRSIGGHAADEEEHQEDRLGFADIVRRILTLYTLIRQGHILTLIRSSCRYKELHDTSFCFKVCSSPTRPQVRADKTEMMAMTDSSDDRHGPIFKAFTSAQRLAEECDKRQVFDLHAIRRQIAPPQQDKKHKKRPRSLGGVHNVHIKERSWGPTRAGPSSEIPV